MKINGNEYSFDLTVSAYLKIAELSPDKSFEKYVQLTDPEFTPSEIERFKNTLAAAIIMNDAYVRKIEREHPGQTAPRLSAIPEEDLFDMMTLKEWNNLQIELSKTIAAGEHVTIKATPPEESGNVPAAV